MTVDVHLREYQETDLLELAPQLRVADQREILLTSGRTPLAALTHAVEASCQKRVVMVDGQPAGITGLGLTKYSEAGEVIGVPWLLGTLDLLHIPPRHWVTLGHTEIERWLGFVPWLKNFVYAENKASCRWLSHIGFDLHPAQPFGPQGAPFHPFELKRDTFIRRIKHHDDQLV